MSLNFKPAFQGPKNVYVLARDQFDAESEWRQLGSWHSINVPVATYVSPNSGSGPGSSFQFNWSDATGGSNIRRAWVLIGPRLAWQDSCSISYESDPGIVSLSRGDGDNWSEPAPLVPETALSSPLCALRQPSVSRSGEWFALSATLEFSEAFNGEKRIWLRAQNNDGAVSEWTEMGRYTVAAPNQPPQVSSISHSSHAGPGSPVVVEVTDANGAADLSVVEVLVNSTNNPREACYVEAYLRGRYFGLRSDNGESVAAASGFSAPRRIENSYCVLDGTASAVETGKDSVKIRFAILPKGPLAGDQTIFVRARDALGASSPWAQSGPWTVPPDPNNQPPEIAAAATPPPRGHFASFQLLARDPDSAMDLASIDLLLGGSPEDAAPCWLRFSRRAGTLQLLSEDGQSWLSPPPDRNVVEHSRCSIPAGASSALSGAELRVTLGAAFRPPLAGNKSVWVRATDAAGASSGWRKLGDFTVEFPAANRPPRVSPVAPATGAGPARNFVFGGEDPDGYQDIRLLRFYLRSADAPDKGCLIEHDRLSGLFYLLSDDSPEWSAPLPAARSAGNSRCRLLSAYMHSYGGLLYRVSATVAFNSELAGSVRLLQQVVDMAGVESGWSETGVWSATYPNRAPSAATVSPSSGEGAEQDFEFVIRDPDGAADLSWVYLTFAPGSSLFNNCHIAVSPSSPLLYIFDDPRLRSYGMTLGSGGVLENGQCSISLKHASTALDGDAFIVRLRIRFLAGLSGDNFVSVSAYDTLSATLDLRQLASWRVPPPGPNRPPETLALTAEASSTSATLRASYSDPDGYGDLAALDLRLGEGPGACAIRYDRPAHAFQISTGTGDGWKSPVAANSGELVENAACSFTPWSVRYEGSGQTLTLTVPVTLKSAALATASRWLAATDRAGSQTGWQPK